MSSVSFYMKSQGALKRRSFYC